MQILRDLTPDVANAGPDRGVCDSAIVNLAALTAGNGGTGTWAVLSGGGFVTDIHDPGSALSNLSFGDNQFRWNVVSQFGICPGSQDDVTITRDEAPAPAFAGIDQSLCLTVIGSTGCKYGHGGCRELECGEQTCRC